MLQQYFVCLRFGFITTDFTRCWSWLSLALQLLLQSPGSLTAFRTWTSMVTSTHTSRRGSNRTTLTRTTTTTTTRSTTIRSHRNRCRASLSLSYVFLSRSALFCSPLWLSFSPTRAFSLCHALFTVFSIYISLSHDSTTTAIGTAAAAAAVAGTSTSTVLCLYPSHYCALLLSPLASSSHPCTAAAAPPCSVPSADRTLFPRHVRFRSFLPFVEWILLFSG